MTSKLVMLGALLAISVAREARANGRFPEADQLVLAPDRAGLLAVRTTFGLLVSGDAGQTWGWVCERAVGYSGVQDPTLGWMSDSTLLAGLEQGLARSPDSGCNWSFAEADLNGSPVIDLSVDKADPRHALALVWDPRTVGYSSRFLSTADGGKTFVAQGRPIDPDVLVLTLDLAASNPERVYASGTRTVGGVRVASLFVSDDAAEHWRELPVPFDPKKEQGLYIAAVDPLHEDTVYLRTSSAFSSRLLVTRDAGQSFEVAYSGSLLAFALSPDGTHVYFGGEDGLHAGLARDLKFERRATVRLLCLAATEDTLYACSDERSGFAVGASHDDGGSFTPLLHLADLRGPLQCAADSSTAECARDWPLVSTQLGIRGESAAGSSGDGESAGASGAPPAPGAVPPAPSSSCALAGANPGLGRCSGPGAGFAGFAALCFSLRCRRRRRLRLPAR